jgi:hypothetical protein
MYKVLAATDITGKSLERGDKVLVLVNDCLVKAIVKNTDRYRRVYTDIDDCGRQSSYIIKYEW